MDKLEKALMAIRNMISNAQDDKIINLEQALHGESKVDLQEVNKKNDELDIKLATLKNVEHILSTINDEEVMRSYDKRKRYSKSSYKDIHGTSIFEGDIITVTSSKGKKYSNAPDIIHAVECHNGVFGSDFFSDFEPLSSYHQIEVIGHIEDYRDEIKSGQFSGNALAILKN